MAASGWPQDSKVSERQGNQLLLVAVPLPCESNVMQGNNSSREVWYGGRPVSKGYRACRGLVVGGLAICGWMELCRVQTAESLFAFARDQDRDQEKSQNNVARHSGAVKQWPRWGGGNRAAGQRTVRLVAVQVLWQRL